MAEEIEHQYQVKLQIYMMTNFTVLTEVIFQEIQEEVQQLLRHLMKVFTVKILRKMLKINL